MYEGLRIIEEPTSDTPMRVEGTRGGNRFTGRLDLLVIRECWGRVNFEDLADGFGPGRGTLGDWSGIRDSSDGAMLRMFIRSMESIVPGAFVGPVHEKAASALIAAAEARGCRFEAAEGDVAGRLCQAINFLFGS